MRAVAGRREKYWRRPGRLAVPPGGARQWPGWLCRRALPRPPQVRQLRSSLVSVPDLGFGFLPVLAVAPFGTALLLPDGVGKRLGLFVIIPVTGSLFLGYAVSAGRLGLGQLT